MTTHHSDERRTFKLTIAYDGTRFAGWQFQPNHPTVQGEIETALLRITGQQERVLASSRTDAGVHAFAQVVSVRVKTTMSAESLGRAIEAVLPEDVAVVAIIEKPTSFHPIRDTISKRYRYIIDEGPARDVFLRTHAWRFKYRQLDVEAMAESARPLIGRHDFAAFETSGAPRQSTVRTVTDLLVCRATIDPLTPRPLRRPGPVLTETTDSPDSARPGPGLRTPAGGANASGRIIIEIQADGFLYNMARNIVGSLVEVGRGKKDVAWITEILATGDRRLAGPTAPAHGLHLLYVEYPP